MKQIKTVIQPIEQALCFDALVNCLLIDGWKLKTRNIITTQGEPTEAFNVSAVRFLYAELEKEDKPYFEEITI